MSSQQGETAPSKETKKPFISTFLTKLRKRHIIETLAAFIGGGWLLVEVVERLLVGHYKFPDESIDLTVVSVIGALLSTLVWRWFGGTEKRPGNIKVEVLLVPLIILATLSIDLIILLEIIGISGKTFLIAAVAVCLGIAWIILKSLQWAAAVPISSPAIVQKPIESSSSASASPEKSIVVLPFTDLSPQKDQEYFCDGMTEEIIADLSQVHKLLVISRSSAMTFKGSSKTVRDIAKELNIRYVMEGSVRKSGNDLRITAQLIDAASDAHLWAEKYSGTLDDVFAIQEKVSGAIVDALKLTLTADEKSRLAARMIPDVKAFDCYLRARQETYRLTKSALDHAGQLVRQAIDMVGPNALLYSLLAEIEFFYHDQGIHPDEETLRRAESWASKAMELEPDSSAGFRARGVIEARRGDMLRAIRDLRRANELQMSGDTLWSLVWMCAEVGKMAEARRYAAEAVAVDPLLWLSRWSYAWVALLDGDFEVALTQMRDAVGLGGGELVQILFLAIFSAYAGRMDEACGLLGQVVDAGESALSTVSAAIRSLFRRDTDAAAELLGSQALRDLARLDKEFSWWLAAACSHAGEADEALYWLANAIDLGFTNHHFFSAIDPFLATLRGDTRFEALMDRAREKQRAFGV
jgi:non-specific serine/threonine protein kinase